MKLIYLPALFAAATLVAACDGPLDVNPTSQVPAEEALDEASEVAAAVRGIYSALQSEGAYDRDHVVYPDLYADNLDFTGTYAKDREVYNRSVTPSNTGVSGIWQAAYTGISRANNVLAAIPTVGDLDEGDAGQFRGEALFLRALNYHTLVRWFGGVPVVTEPTWRIDESVFVARNTQAEVYARIMADLQEAIILLPGSNTEYRATRHAARALMARVALDMGSYAQARDMASAVITSGAYSLVEDFNQLWQVENTSEMILSAQYTVNDPNSLAFWFFTYNLGGRFGFAPTSDLYNAYAANRNPFLQGVNDRERRNGTIGFDADEGELYGRKYFRIATGDDNVPVLRLAEMYLIRAEANARLGAAPEVVLADVNVVRRRAGLPDLTAANTTNLLGAILNERRLEFAFEGHRFFDLRRILGPAAAAAFLEIEQFQLLFPVPQRERDANTALTQNPGY